mgnify:CR=1 FL=1
MRYPCIMTNEDAEQLALDGLAPRKRRKRAPAVKTPAAEHPIAQVVLDIQATHLGQTFDYFVEEKTLRPPNRRDGARPLRRAAGQRHHMETRRYQRHTRIIDTLHRTCGHRPCARSRIHARRYDAHRGRVRRPRRRQYPPPGSAAARGKVESQLRVGNRDAAGTAAGKQRLAAVDQEIYGQLQRQYGNINLLHDALQGRRFQSFVFDLLPGADHWRRCAAWMVPRRSLRTSRRCWCCRPCGRSPT